MYDILYVLIHLNHIDGSVDKYVERFMDAIMKKQAKYVKWPMGEDRKRIMRRHEELFGLPNCIGFLDGSLFPLHQTPHWQPELFWCRKSRSAVQNMVICDFDLHILFGETGHYGSANDPGVIIKGGFLDHIDEYFEDEEYVVADSAYAKTRWCVPVGKSFKYEALTGSDRKFNYFLSRARVSIENCFGVLKGRFPSLDELRIRLNKEEDIDRYSRWIVTCFILHNFCVDNDSPAYMTEIIDYFYRTHDRNEYFETADIDVPKERSSKYSKYFVDTNSVPATHTSEGKEKWKSLKKYILNLNNYNIQSLDDNYKEKYHYE